MDTGRCQVEMPPTGADRSRDGETRVYLIGAGVIARYHAAATSDLAGAGRVLLSVADPNGEALTGFREQFPSAKIFDDAEAMLAEAPRPSDIVVVATPPFTHHLLAVAALESGRHVLSEKPLAMNRDEARDMLRVARSVGRRLGCCSTRFLGLATNEETKRIVESGTLGELYHATFVNRRQRGRSGIEHQPATRWFLERARSGGGTLMDWSPYDLTTLNHILSPIRVDVLAAWTTDPETAIDLPPGTVVDTEQHAGASLRFHRADGQKIDVTLERAACTHGGERITVEIEGRRGAVSWDWLDWLGDGSVAVSQDQDGRVVTETTRLGVGTPLHPHHRPLVYFHQNVQGNESLAVVDEQAVFNFSCIQGIYACARSGIPQSVTLEDRG